MKLIGIVNAHNIVGGFAEKENIGAHLAYVMTKFVIATQGDADFFAKKMRELFIKYGEEKEEGRMEIKPENIKEFQAEIETLQNTEADDPGIRFSLSEMSRELKLSMKQIYPLMDFITDDENKDEE